uniref:histidine triad nucleotide-binding protein n=1 Tax=Castellaniella defragrans TaxID=75697 RepID=UPI00333F8FCE
MSHDCLFCKIAQHQIPSATVYEDDEFMAFKDIHPAAPVHLLLVPKRHIESLAVIEAGDADWLGRMMRLVPQIAYDNGCNPGPEGGFRLVANTGLEGGQEIAHLHFHILGGPRPWDKRAAPAA